MVAGKLFAPIRGSKMRITRLDECGVPVAGPATTRVSAGFVSIALTMNYEDTNDITVKNASGQVRFSEPADSFVSSVAAEITFTEVDPDLFSMMSGNPTVLDATSEAVGFRLSGDVSLQGNWSAPTTWWTPPPWSARSPRGRCWTRSARRIICICS
jgi:hypothetical protein